MARAIRDGEPVHLRLCGPLSRGTRARRGVRLDEIVPLCSSVEVADVELLKHVEQARAPQATPGSGHAVTAVIPTRGDSHPAVDALLSQDVDVRVLVLSNGAGPTRIPGADVIRIPWRGHGPTRQEAIAHVQTPYVFFTVDDAIPLGAGCLRTLIEALQSGDWDAVTGRQIPWPDADAVTAARLRRWTPPGRDVVVTEQVDHVAAVYRTDTLRRHPLPDVPIAEDAWWSMGKRIGYVPTAPVLHSHTRSPGALYRRNRDIHAQLVAMGRAARVPSIGALVGALPGSVRPTLSGGVGELFNQVAELLGQWRGGGLSR